ncbi:MAG: hypothetical protein OXN89_15775 [Bryobacterales bacterium]|nr:hypothetical protein [Bryobacterales bacterium]
MPIVERTNNSSGDFFASANCRLWRRSRRASLGQAMQDEPAHGALTANLLHPKYADNLCGTLEDLLRAFSQLGTSQSASNGGTLDRPENDPHLFWCKAWSLAVGVTVRRARRSQRSDHSRAPLRVGCNVRSEPGKPTPKLFLRVSRTTFETAPKS